MDVLEIIALVLAVLGIAGSILPALPGPPFSGVALLLLYLNHNVHGGDEMSLGFLIFWIIAVVAVTILDYVIPSSLTRISGAHKEASRGAMLGMFAGILLTPIGMVAGALLGAFFGELSVARGDVAGAIKAALSTFLGFILTTGLKLIICVIITYYTIVYIF